ncbi:MAG TPA: SRPBCC domain-containing protein [Terriglobales bacterium]|nr:SRPBCC domain-containing protein [Terriglobales bacterium]
MKSEVKVGDNRLQISRLFDAPRDLVFAYWKEVDRLQQWWGCKDTTKVDCTMDFRVGGFFVCVMQITGAGEFSYKGQYDEIVEPAKIAYHADFGPTTTRVVVEFFEQGAQTKMVLTQAGFPGQSICETVSQGTKESFDKLDSLLASQALERVS